MPERVVVDPISIRESVALFGSRPREQVDKPGRHLGGALHGFDQLAHAFDVDRESRPIG